MSASDMPDLGRAHANHLTHPAAMSAAPVLFTTLEYALPGGRSGMALARRVLWSMLGAFFFAVGVASGANAQSTNTLAWQALAGRCADAISSGNRVDNEGLQPFSPVEDVVWPDFQIWSFQQVAVFQETLATGATEPIRVCRVVLQPGADPQTTELIISNLEMWRQRQLESGAFEEARMRTPPEGTIRFLLDSVGTNQRNCRVRIDFQAQPGRVVAQLEIKERPSATCGLEEG